MHTPGTDLQLVDTIDTANHQPPFHQALKEWMAANGKRNLQQMLRNPQGCGLGGQIDFNRQMLEDFVLGQYGAFWTFFSRHAPPAATALEDRKRNFRYFFTEAAFTGLQALLMVAIENGALPHPQGKEPGTIRAGKPGSLESDCERAIGSARAGLTNNLGATISDPTHSFSSGSLAHDRILIYAMSHYLGLDGDTVEYLDGRVLKHFGLPNIHEAHGYGAHLHTALLQVYGIDDKRTTAEEVIRQQLRTFSWSQAYLKPPLLDEVLKDALCFYNPERVREFYMDTFPDEVDDMEKRITEAEVIARALLEFRDRMCGTTTVVSATRLGVDRTQVLED